MEDNLITLIKINFRDFKFSNVQQGIFNELYVTLPQYDALVKFLSDVKPEIGRIISSYSEPDHDDMEMMDVKREEVGYRSIDVSIVLDETTHLPKDWRYKMAYLVKGKDGNPCMAFGDRHYNRQGQQI